MRAEVTERIEQLLPVQHQQPELNTLYGILRDYPSRGGKGIRSELLLLTAQAYGVTDHTAEAEAALWLATAIELFQTWALIHDDIEDDSEVRRGRPTLHRLHGIPIAINAGDAVHVYMWQAVFRAALPGANNEVLHMIHRTIEGQHVDLTWVHHGTWDLQEADYLRMVELKTSYYTVVTPLRLGMISAAHTPDPRLLEAGLALGAAFQIRDDVLNLVGNGDAYGKEIAGDLLEGKRTLIALRWLSKAPGHQRAVFLAEMRKPRDAKDPEVMARILKWIRTSDAVDHATNAARALAEQGLNTMEEVLKDAPDQGAAQEIRKLLARLATRNA